MCTCPLRPYWMQGTRLFVVRRHLDGVAAWRLGGSHEHAGRVRRWGRTR
jgi:hypothetical protein